jgi:hypothetical protein
MKIKRFIFVVCLVLIVSSFASSMAAGNETVTTVTCKPGALLGNDETLNQICDIAAIRVHSMPEGYGALTLALNDVDTLSILLKLEENGFYLQSQALGVTPLYFSWEDLKTLLMNQLQSGSEMVASDSMFGGEFFQAMLDGTMTEEKAMEMMGIDEGLTSFAADIEAAQTVENGAFSLDGSDVATQKTVTAITTDDMTRAMDLTIVRKLLTNITQMNSPALTGDEVTTAVEEQIAQAKQAIQDGNLNMTVTAYTTDGAFVALECLFSGSMDGATQSMAFTVTKTSIDQAQYFQMKFKLFDGQNEFANQYASLYVSDTFLSGLLRLNTFENEPFLNAAFNCDTSDPAQTSGELSFTSYDAVDIGAGSLLLTFDQQRNDTATDTAIDLYVSEGSVDDIKAALSDTSVIGLRFQTVTQTDTGFFAGLEGAAPDTSVQPLQMTEDELNAYLQAIQQSVMMAVLTVAENLPSDISDSLLQGMGVY